jgi:hypothetical protein
MVIMLKNFDLLGDSAFSLVKSAVLEFCTVGGVDDGPQKMLWTDVRTHISKEEQ